MDSEGEDDTVIVSRKPVANGASSPATQPTAPQAPAAKPKSSISFANAVATAAANLATSPPAAEPAHVAPLEIKA